MSSTGSFICDKITGKCHKFNCAYNFTFLGYIHQVNWNGHELISLEKMKNKKKETLGGGGLYHFTTEI